jgi:hypothetical protein
VQNFIEMRDKTASRVFRAKKKLDHLLEGLLPGIYLPLYTMVTFTRIPYAEAARRAAPGPHRLYSSRSSGDVDPGVDDPVVSLVRDLSS